jgi:hypothetical protein
VVVVVVVLVWELSSQQAVQAAVEQAHRVKVVLTTQVAMEQPTQVVVVVVDLETQAQVEQVEVVWLS